MKRWGVKTLWLAILLALGGGGYLVFDKVHAGGSAVRYRTEPVVKGNLLSTIAASGSLEPEEAIDVGAQVAGQISRFGTVDGKPIDRRSFVKAGQLLAEIDPSLYKLDLESAQAQLAQNKALLSQSNAQLEQSDAQVAQAEANVVKAEADIQQMEAKKFQGEQDWNRAQKLVKETADAMTEMAFDGYKAAFMTAVANLSSANAVKVQAEAARTQAKAARSQALAAIEQAKAVIRQTQASVDRAQRNLDYCTITSPVDGVVIDRRVNIGQTVVSSLNAPSLFLIAKDLARMQIWVSVNEADIGSIHNDQPVTFTVDARPGVVFTGKVTKVRFDATMTQNVVTYPVEVLALNPDGLLYPYMTANVQFELDKRTDVLKVPNAALRYLPLTEEQVAPECRGDAEKIAQEISSRDTPATGDPRLLGQGSGTSGGGGGAHRTSKNPNQGLLWIQQGAFLRPIVVRVGMSDGAMTEVESSELKEGLAVVISEQRSGAAQGEASPFLPQMRRR
jgi:HlyD family secretion protein